MSNCYKCAKSDIQSYCQSCGQVFCDKCMQNNNTCKLCSKIRNYKYPGKSIKKARIDNISTYEYFYNLSNISYGTQKIIFGANTGNYYFMPGLLMHGKPQKNDYLNIYFLDVNSSVVASVWSAPKESNEIPALIYCSADIRHFTDNSNKMLLYLSGALLTIMVLITISRLNWILGLVACLVAGFFIFKYIYENLIIESNWKPEETAFNGTPLYNSEILFWTKINSIKNTAESGWKMFVKVKRQDNHKIMHVLIEDKTKQPVILEKDKIYKFSGRELYGVLICEKEIGYTGTGNVKDNTMNNIVYLDENLDKILNSIRPLQP